VRVAWTRSATRDLEAIGDFIDRDDSQAAARTVRRILERADILAAHPLLGRPGRVAGTRELVVVGTPFVIPYRVVGDLVEIIAVFHGARRWPMSF